MKTRGSPDLENGETGPPSSPPEPNDASGPPRLGRFESDLRGHLIRTDLRWREITGLVAERAMGDGWIRAIHPEDREDFVADWSWASRDTRDIDRVFRILTPTGALRTIFVFAWPVRDRDGNPCGYTGTIEDITERRQHRG